MSDGAGRVFGIDLGTTYSAIAYIDDAGRPTVCRNDTGAELTPSVVQFESANNVVVGEAAKQSAYIDADQVVSLIKRRMGDDREYEFHGAVHTPESISALILRRLATDAAGYTDGPVNRVVITVPAYFGARQKEATRKAGLIAGLDVVGILPEPVAAAVHYDLTSSAQERTVLVYDLGGGTFDTTVIKVGTSDITVLCTDGDTNLGGADWDERLCQHLLDRFRAAIEETGGQPDDSADDDPEFLQEVVGKAEELKRQLSHQQSRPVQLRFAGAAARIEVTRDEFETMTADLLDRTVAIVRRTLDALEQRQPGARIDEVLLVGGSTRMPVVAARLAAEFGWQAKLHDPELAVAKGAAVFALSRVVYRMQQQARQASASPAEAEQAASDVVGEVARQVGIPEQSLAQLVAKRTQSVLPRAFGVRLADGEAPDRFYVEHLAHANDPLPTGPRTIVATTVSDNQTSVLISVYEQAGPVLSPELAGNTALTNGSGVITGIPPRPRGVPAIDVEMSIDEDGLLQLHATERESGQDLRIEVNVGLSADELSEAIQAVSAIAVSS